MCSYIERTIPLYISQNQYNNKTNTSWIYINELSNDIERRLYKTLDDIQNFMY